MYLQVDLREHPPIVTLEEPDDCRRFQVSVIGGSDAGLVFGALVNAAAGRLEGEDAYITVDAVRRMAAGRVGDDWEADFAAMLDFAKRKGWLDERGVAVQAHVEWPQRS